ncbi:MAG TPA: CCA tRNA nucleotidyltransferase [Thermoguttaceae bacterium]
MTLLTPEAQRRFALDVVRKLREAGFSAYWAGGCVRDQLLGRTPKDYDVATNATPEQIREIFGRRRTLAIGASFGVITVKGPRAAGMIEVATFRKDSAYSDGRHPDNVIFCTAREDALRRDFTINGLFFDPFENRVIDFVGGQEDLALRRIRAIGRPRERFAEDKLRMLRAVRFSAAFDFALEDEIRDAIRDMAAEISVVSPERIAAEMNRMLVDPSRVAAIRLLLDTDLAASILLEIVPQNEEQTKQLEQALQVMGRLKGPGFALALAALLHTMSGATDVEVVCRRWRLSNAITDRAVWLVEKHAAIADPQAMKWSALQPILITDGIEDLLKLMEATSAEGAAAYCREKLRLPPDELNPPPLVTGEDLLQLGIPQGPQYRSILQKIREMQLDGELLTREAALVSISSF